jgi:ubiquinone/menaquinone biosynthesis C-methylase UbiE/DNA-binding transcriptional ArsR family regulator
LGEWRIVASGGKLMTVGSLDWLQTLADHTRVRLLAVLQKDEFSVGELCTIVQLPQSTVSRHLKVLSEDGWIGHRREGTNQLYSVSRGGWCAPRNELWDWVTSQHLSSKTLSQDQARMNRIIVERSRSEAFFSSSADQWDQLRVELFGSHLDSAVLAATLPSDSVIAELGCGSAPLAQLTAPFVQKVFAIDSSQAMLSAARHRLAGVENVVLEQASLSSLPLADDCCDAAWMVLVLPYMEQPESAFAESARILKSGAPLVVLDLQPHERHSYRQVMGHVRLGVERQELANWFQESGLQLESYYPLPPDTAAKGPALFVAVGRRNVPSPRKAVSPGR